MAELSTGADRHGFNPLPGVLNIPNSPAVPGDLTYWKPLWADVEIAWQYAAQVYAGTKNKTLLNLLGKYQVGDRN